MTDVDCYNMSVVRGSQIIVSCRVLVTDRSMPVLWSHLRPGIHFQHLLNTTKDINGTSIYNGFEIRTDCVTHFSINDGGRNLLINSTEMSDAGTFICTVARSGSRDYVQLTVRGMQHLYLGINNKKRV